MPNIKDKQNIVKSYKEEQRDFILGSLIIGQFHSAFTNIPQAVTFKEHNYLFYSNQPAQILVIGDSDFIRDNVKLKNEFIVIVHGIGNGALRLL